MKNQITKSEIITCMEDCLSFEVLGEALRACFPKDHREESATVSDQTPRSREDKLELFAERASRGESLFSQGDWDPTRKDKVNLEPSRAAILAQDNFQNGKNRTSGLEVVLSVIPFPNEGEYAKPKKPFRPKKKPVRGYHDRSPKIPGRDHYFRKA